MKLFIALLFEEEQKNIIYDILQEIKLISRSGNFYSLQKLAFDSWIYWRDIKRAVRSD